MLNQSTFLLFVYALYGVTKASMPLMYEHGYDNYGPKLIQPISGPTYKPSSYDWKENSFQGEDDYYRWLYNKDDFGHRFGKQVELAYPNSGPIGYGHFGGKLSDQEQGYMIDPENIPITIMLKTPSSPINPLSLHHIRDNSFVRPIYSEDGPNHMIHRVTKPVIQEIHEIITPFKKVNHEIVQLKEDMKATSNGAPMTNYLNKNTEGLLKNYFLMRDKNAHNFGTFNKLYDLGLQMNKANGYVLSQGHSQEDIDDPEPEAASSDESNNKTQQA